jgi:hypothetical protein
VLGLVQAQGRDGDVTALGGEQDAVRRVRGAGGVLAAVDGQVVGVVGDAAVGVHAATVRRTGVEQRVVARVAELRRVAHVAEPVVAGAVLDDVLADQPVRRPGRVGLLRVGVVLHRVAHHVAERLVEGAGLVLVDEVGGELGDAVRHLVAVHVQAAGQRQAGAPVAVAVGHELAVPEGVAVARGVVHLRDDPQALVVQAVAVEHLAVEVVDDPGVVVRVDCRGLARGGDPLVEVPDVVGVGHHHAAGLHRGVLQVVGLLPVVAGLQLVEARRRVLDGVELLGVALDAGPGALGQAAVRLDDLAGVRVDPADRALVGAQALHLVEVLPGARVDLQLVAERATGADLALDDRAGLALGHLDRVGGPEVREVRADDRGGLAGRVLDERDLPTEHRGIAQRLLVARLGGAVGPGRRPHLVDVARYDVRLG